MNARLVDFSLLLLRISLGVIVGLYGMSKLFGAPPNGGVAQTIAGFQKMGYPSLLAWVVMLVEFVGGIMLVVGLWTKASALAYAGVIAGIIYTHIAKFNCMSKPFTSGPLELPLLALAGAVVLFTTGAGRVSFDWAVWGKKGKGF
jgi:putative oxidoreductase